jgi:hypothetical protein
MMMIMIIIMVVFLNTKTESGNFILNALIYFKVLFICTNESFITGPKRHSDLRSLEVEDKIDS